MTSHSVSLSFGSGGAKSAWDDRELINVYDAAMEEFHSHHPGPGSWLDKATAAQTAGMPLVDSNAYATAWYSATSAANVEAQDERPIARPLKRPRTTDNVDTRQVNPYAEPSTNAKSRREARRERPKSPQYVPPSPPPETRVPSNDTDGCSAFSLSDYDAGNSGILRNGSPSNSHPASHLPAPPAPIAIHPTTSLSAEDALSYAMTSQYWAGYWMGVSQAMRDTASLACPSPISTPLQDSAPNTNVKRTAHQFAKHKQIKR